MYKFRELNKTTYDLLLNSELWCASPMSLNDPFDAQFDYESFAQKVSSSSSVDSYTKHLIHNASQVFDNVGICSLSAQRDNQVMWSHYADEHRGLCIEFDIPKIMKLNNVLSLARVTYQSELPELKLVKTFAPNSDALFIASAIDTSMFMNILTTKDVTWRYENEIRIIKPQYGAIKFTPDCIVSISFGIRTTERDMLSVKRLLSSQLYSHIKWYKAKKSTVTYSLDFELLEI
ncbi:DUF2971 domain-containing protein [Aliivibrio fischeri]|uniref:DUF2971 domain-containing protein n=1 Tax=Aliivibrio fischeri TaxID=668 RepID=UPI00080E13EE|nr:DUF2971 domain-containing protein [Aliivibrio fischeri]OCH36196.1 hypothetical protein A6E02_19025 [Aliivibrio fischeri]